MNWTMEALVRELIRLLDIVEESDEGRLFHPNQIMSCRVMDGKQLSFVLTELRKMTHPAATNPSYDRYMSQK